MNRSAYLSLIVLSCFYSQGLPSAAAQVSVSTATELENAVRMATAGTTIEVAAGTYNLDGNLVTQRSGSEGSPIVVRGPDTGEAVLHFERTDGGYVEGFKIEHAWWVIEGLTLESTCGDESRCEHAFHIIGDADHLIIRNNIVRDFNAHIKANRQVVGGASVFPDDVLIEGNEFFNRAVRATSNPVTPIDVVGGRRWVIRANFIHDHAKGEGNEISYAAFLKGNSRDGIIEGNLVICELLHTGGIRLGLSFGGGGSNPPEICEDGSCSPEHQNGIMRNNVIVNCPRDVGVFVRECDGCAVLHNTLYNSTGVDFLEGSTGRVEGNLMSGRIRDRDSSSTTRGVNLENVSEADFMAWFTEPGRADFSLRGDGSVFVDQGVETAGVSDDFCRRSRMDGQHDLGAVEYIDGELCDTTTPFTGMIMNPVPDAGPGGMDASVPGMPDAGVDAQVQPDGSSAADASTMGGTVEGGCGCVTMGRPDSNPRPGALALVLLCALLRRRK